MTDQEAREQRIQRYVDVMREYARQKRQIGLGDCGDCYDILLEEVARVGRLEREVADCLSEDERQEANQRALVP